MNRSFKFTSIVSLVAVLALLLMSVAAVAYAEEEEIPAHYTDGRLNEFDINAPVAIFAHYDYPYADDINLGVLNRIEFWGMLYDGSIDKVLEVTAADINAVSANEESVLVASENGYALYLETDGSLTIVAPTAADGTTYQFNWEQSF